MAITANNFSHQAKDGLGSAYTTFTVAHTINSGSDRVMWVGVIADVVSAQTISASSDLDGDLGAAVSTLAGSASSQQCTVFRKIAPTVGAHTITITKTSNSNSYAAMVRSYDGVDQTTPDADFTQDSGVDAALSNTVPNVVSGNMVLDFGAINGNPTVTVGANQTQLVNANVPENTSASNGTMYVSSDQAGADGGDMSWTWTGNQRNAHISCRIIASGDASGSAPVITKLLTLMGVGV